MSRWTDLYDVQQHQSSSWPVLASRIFSILNLYKMASMLATILTVLVTTRAALALVPANSNPVATLWTFPNETWIENLAVRANGDVLCTSLNRNAIYKVNPFDHIAETLHQFSSTDGCLGISETASDIFVVVTANVSLKTNTAWPGSAKIWHVDVRAWELVSHIHPFVNGKQCSCIALGIT
jgi:hypothetical protein